MARFRHRLARWLVGPFFLLPATGSWMVHRDAESDTTFGIRVAEWTGELRTDLAPLEYGTGELPHYGYTTTTGDFSGKFA